MNNIKVTRILDFDQLAVRKYQLDPRNELAKKQENYINDLRKAYTLHTAELEPILLKCELLQTERKQLMDEIEQYKISQLEILKKFESEYQERDKLQKMVSKQQHQILQLQKMQIPKEFQQKKCLELQESLNATLSEIIHDFVQQYDNFLNQQDDQGDYDELVESLLHQIEECVNMFVENLPAQSSRNHQNEEVQHIKDQLANVFQQLQNAQQESQDLSDALDAEKQYCSKINQQRNTAQQLNQQYQTQIEQLKNDFKSLQEQNQYLELRVKEYHFKAQEIQKTCEEEKENLKSELIESIKQLQTELSKFQQENSYLKERLNSAEEQTHNNYENTLQKLRDLESKLVQENIKLEQKVRECTRLEKELTQQKGESAKLFEEKNVQGQQIELLKEKRKQDKEVHEGIKDKLKKLKQKSVQQEEEYKIQIELLEQKVQELQENKPPVEEGKKDENFERDLKITKLEQTISELQQKYSEQKQYSNLCKIELNQKNEETKELHKTVKMLQEKREYAQIELKRLASQCEAQRHQQYDQKMSNLIQSSFQSNQIPATPDKNSDLNSSQISHRSNKSRQSTSFFQSGINFIKQQPTQLVQSSDQKIPEKCIQIQAEDLKKTLESLYKSYITSLILSEQDTKGEFMQLGIQIHECVKKTQDLFDNIEDFLIQ